MHGSAVLEVAPQRLPDLYAGAPAMVSVKLDPRGGELVIRGRTATGDFEERHSVPALHTGEGSRAIATLFGRELVEDLEQNRIIENNVAAFEPRIEQAGLEFQIATRLTSWVAVSEWQTVDPTAPRRTETQPHAHVFGMSVEGVGLRAPQSPLHVGPPAQMRALRAAPSPKQMAREYAEMGAEEPEPELEPAPESGGVAPSELPAAPLPAKKKSDSFSERVRRTLGLSGASQGGSPLRRLLGALVQLTERRLVVTIAVEAAGLRWAPSMQVRVELSDGSFVAATVVYALTTAKGEYAQGVTVTLVLDVPAGIRGPTTIHLVNHDENVEISL
jgi:Ca-activated chloride channel family protein